MVTVNARGVGLGVSRYGRPDGGQPGGRPVLVLVHGLGVGARTNLSLTVGMPMAAEAEVIAYDLRGHGRSEWTASSYGLADHMEDLVALLDALAVTEPVHLVAHCYGGAIALLTAMTYPDRVASVCLIEGIFPFEGWGEQVLKPLRKAADGLRRVEDREETVDRMMELFGDPARRRATVAVERAQRLLLGTTLLDDLRDEPALGREDYARIQCPVAGVYGYRSRVYPIVPKLEAVLPEMQRYTIVGGDHHVHITHAPEVRAVVRQTAGLAPVGSETVPHDPSPPAQGPETHSVALMSPLFPTEPDTTPFPWEWLDRHETNILVFLGAVSAEIAQPFLGTVLAALAGKPYGIVMVGPAGSLPEPPENVLVLPAVPRVALLPRVKAVVCDAGHSTVREALAYGVPLVCVPTRDDQQAFTEQIVRAGVGRRIEPARAGPEDIAAAIDDVLGDLSYETRACRIAMSFSTVAGGPAAAGHLEKLLTDAS